MTDYRSFLGLDRILPANRGGKGVRVAVVDSGVPYGVCRVSRHRDFSGGDDGSDHCSLVGSILFGRSEVIGICPEATAYFANVFDGNTASPESVASAIEYASGVWRADIINLSLGFSGDSECPECVRKACEAAVSRGSVVIAAAGEPECSMMWPAALDGVLSVGASELADTDGLCPDIRVPGMNLDGISSNGVVKVTGSSFAAAVASGIAALYMSESMWKGKVPSPDLVKEYLKSVKLRGKFHYRLMANGIFGTIASFSRRILHAITRR